MNKKLLILGALATALLITACVKKDSPGEDEQEQTATSQAEPADFKALEAVQVQEEATAASEIDTASPTKQSVAEPGQYTHTESSDTQTTATTSNASANAQSTKTVAGTTQPAEEKNITTTAPQSVASSNKAQSEDDAVAAAIAAATPALKN